MLGSQKALVVRGIGPHAYPLFDEIGTALQIQVVATGARHVVVDGIRTGKVVYGPSAPGHVIYQQNQP